MRSITSGASNWLLLLSLAGIVLAFTASLLWLRSPNGGSPASQVATPPIDVRQQPTEVETPGQTPLPVPTAPLVAEPPPPVTVASLPVAVRGASENARPVLISSPQPVPADQPVAAATRPTLASDGAAGSPPTGARAPFCTDTQKPALAAPIAPLGQRLGSLMGEATECPHDNPENGDLLQQTSAGLAYLRRASQRPTFTDGYRHWAILGDQVVYWEGYSPDPT